MRRKTKTPKPMAWAREFEDETRLGGYLVLVFFNVSVSVLVSTIVFLACS
jgi:hypothetical protein